MYVHQSGFRPLSETLTTHGRRRYRLTPSRGLTTSAVPIDPSLWIVHYHQADPQSHFPVAKIQITNEVRHSLNERRALQRQQLVRKDFMLNDRDSWPTINLPGRMAPPYAQQSMGYPNNVMAHMNRNQHPSYLQQPQVSVPQGATGPSSAKRPRHLSSGHANPSATAIPMPVASHDAAYDDEETASGADYMDILTPQDISRQRYKQHHEWLEEVLSSPFETRQIIPGTLALGRKGELESLTRDFFDAQEAISTKENLPLPGHVTREHVDSGKPVVEDVKSARVGRIEAGKADDFAKRATQRIAEINAEMDILKKQHARRMAKLSKGHAWGQAEQTLRAETQELIHGNVRNNVPSEEASVLELTRAMEKRLGKQIKPTKKVECLDHGGLEERNAVNEDFNHDFGMIEKFDESHPTPPQVESQITSAINQFVSAGELAGSFVASVEAPSTANTDSREIETNQADESKEVGAEDWVMVNKEGQSTVQDQDQAGLDSFINDSAIQSHIDDLPRQDMQEAQDGAVDGADVDFDTNFGESIDFGDLNTTGEDLAGFEQEPGDIGRADTQEMEVDGSALTGGNGEEQNIPE